MKTDEHNHSIQRMGASRLAQSNSWLWGGWLPPLMLSVRHHKGMKLRIRSVGLVACAVGGLLGLLYIGSYLLWVKPGPPSGFGPFVVHSDGSVLPTTRVVPNEIVYHRLFAKLHLSARVYDPILHCDQRLRPRRWSTIETNPLLTSFQPNKNAR
jgi:hypothetical protein